MNIPLLEATKAIVLGCPECGARLQRLSGSEGYAVEPVAPALRGGKVFERKRLATIYACRRCEHVQEGA